MHENSRSCRYINTPHFSPDIQFWSKMYLLKLDNRFGVANKFKGSSSGGGGGGLSPFSILVYKKHAI